MTLLAAGCGRVTDSEQLRLCRAILPVLHAEGDGVRARSALRRGSRQVRRAHRLCGARAGHACGARTSLTCGFGGTTFERDRLDLVAVETDGRHGRVRRGSPSSSAFSPRPATSARRSQTLPELPAAAAYALQQLINALALAAVYALLATAYSLIYGLVGRINLGVRRDRGARCLRGDRRRRGRGRAGHRRPDRLAGARARDRGGDRGRLEPAGRPRRGRAAACAPSARPADPDRDRRGRALDQRIHAHHSGFARALGAAGVQSAARAGERGEFRRDRDADAGRGRAAGTCGGGAVLWLLGRTRFGRAWRAFADDPGTAALLGVDGGGCSP